MKAGGARRERLPKRPRLAYHLRMADAVLLAVRWAHTLAAVVWVGGGVFYWLAVRPSVRAGALSPEAARAVGERFGKAAALTMWTLAVTGAALFFASVSETYADPRYVAVIAVKVALSAWMFFVAISRRKRIAEAAARPSGRIRAAAGALGHINIVVILGVVIFVISDMLRVLALAEAETN